MSRQWIDGQIYHCLHSPTHDAQSPITCLCVYTLHYELMYELLHSRCKFSSHGKRRLLMTTVAFKMIWFWFRYSKDIICKHKKHRLDRSYYAFIITQELVVNIIAVLPRRPCMQLYNWVKHLLDAHKISGYIFWSDHANRQQEANLVGCVKESIFQASTAFPIVICVSMPR